MRLARGIFWWSVTILVLVVVDDLVFGPVFWLLALWNRFGAMFVAFFASWAFGTWLVFRGTRDQPGHVAAFFLNRLWLERGNPEIASRERKVHEAVRSALAAVVATPFVGGVVPSLVLYKRDALPVIQVRRLAIFLAALYAAEFAAIHGYGLGGVLRAIVGGIG